MSTRKQKLIKALKLVINNLKNDTANYEWNHQSTCNCGLVAQAITNLSQHELAELSHSMFDELDKKYKDNKSTTISWQLAVKEYCPLTGEPLKDILKKLFQNGLTKEDMVHLEYMTNPAILKKSGIRVSKFPYFGKFVGSFFPIKDYHSKQQNLILYLQAWVSILENEISIYANDTLSKIELEEKLLIVVADEDFEEAAKIRDLINKI